MLKLNKKSISKLGDKNPQWKGNDVGMSKLHAWVKERLPKPDICPKCNLRKAYDLANKGIYDRNLENWEYLCRKCHMESDGRLTNFLKHQTKFAKGNECYKLARRIVGEECKSSKLTEQKVREIRARYATGEYTLEDLGKEYGVCFQSISMVINFKIWKHVID